MQVKAANSKMVFAIHNFAIILQFVSLQNLQNLARVRIGVRFGSALWSVSGLKSGLGQKFANCARVSVRVRVRFTSKTCVHARFKNYECTFCKLRRLTNCA